MNIKMTLGLFLLTIGMLTLVACGGDNSKSGSGDSACGGDSAPAVPDDLKGRKAPDDFKADLDKGKQLYGICAACHGPDGKGVEATGGADLTKDSIADDYMYFRISKGDDVKVDGAKTVMTGYRKPAGKSDADYENEVWNIIAYIKSLK